MHLYPESLAGNTGAADDQCIAWGSNQRFLCPDFFHFDCDAHFTASSTRSDAPVRRRWSWDTSAPDFRCDTTLLGRGTRRGDRTARSIIGAPEILQKPITPRDKSD
jgi:hypothetical protein